MRPDDLPTRGSTVIVRRRGSYLVGVVEAVRFDSLLVELPDGADLVPLRSARRFDSLRAKNPAGNHSRPGAATHDA